MSAEQRQLFQDSLLEDKASRRPHLAELGSTLPETPLAVKTAPRHSRRQALPEHLRLTITITNSKTQPSPHPAGELLEELGVKTGVADCGGGVGEAEAERMVSHAITGVVSAPRRPPTCCCASTD